MLEGGERIIDQSVLGCDQSETFMYDFNLNTPTKTCHLCGSFNVPRLLFTHTNIFIWSICDY